MLVITKAAQELVDICEEIGEIDFYEKGILAQTIVEEVDLYDDSLVRLIQRNLDKEENLKLIEDVCICICGWGFENLKEKVEESISE